MKHTHTFDICQVMSVLVKWVLSVLLYNEWHICCMEGARVFRGQSNLVLQRRTKLWRFSSLERPVYSTVQLPFYHILVNLTERYSTLIYLRQWRTLRTNINWNEWLVKEVSLLLWYSSIFHPSSSSRFLSHSKSILSLLYVFVILFIPYSKETRRIRGYCWHCFPRRG